LNKTRFKTHEQILENPTDELEIEYRNAEIRQQADTLEEKLSRNPKTYRALLQELAKRELDRDSRRQPQIIEAKEDDIDGDKLL
jgi:hypothetical protein